MKRLFKFTYCSLPIIAVLFAFVSMTSCKSGFFGSNEPKRGVVGVVNMHYFEILFPGGVRWYCEGVDSAARVRKLYLESSEIKKSLQVTTGTAAFVDDYGTLLTSQKVAHPQAQLELIRRNPQVFLNSIKEQCMQYLDTLDSRYDTMEVEKTNCYEDNVDGYEYVQEAKLVSLEREQDAMLNRAGFYRLLLRKVLDIGSDLSTVQFNVIGEIGLLFDGDTLNDVVATIKKYPCTYVYGSDSISKNLALIRLQNEMTPEEAYVFDMVGAKRSHLTWDDEYVNNEPITGVPLTKGMKMTVMGVEGAKLKKGARVNVKTKETSLADVQKCTVSGMPTGDTDAWIIVDEDNKIRAVSVASDGGYKTIGEKTLSKFLTSYFEVDLTRGKGEKSAEDKPRKKLFDK